mgnify:CR=1 FL=1
MKWSKYCKSLQDTKVIKIDWSNQPRKATRGWETQTNALRKKIMLENQGYRLVCTKQTGFDKWELHYKK